MSEILGAKMPKKRGGPQCIIGICIPPLFENRGNYHREYHIIHAELSQYHTKISQYHTKISQYHTKISHYTRSIITLYTLDYHIIHHTPNYHIIHRQMITIYISYHYYPILYITLYAFRQEDVQNITLSQEIITLYTMNYHVIQY